MKVMFAAYRDWARTVLPTIQRHPRVTKVDHVVSLDELELAITGINGFRVTEPRDTYDLVMLCGWSWQVSQRLLNTVLVVSEHPAYLDEYSLGTPLQNQVHDGITRTKHRVVKIGYPELGERLYSPAHEVDMNLTGNMDDVLTEMASTAKTIYTRFLDDYPNIDWQRWPKAGVERMRRPLVPANSELTRDDLNRLTTKELYDRMRMLEAPYPNAFVEDDAGVLYFERVRWKSKR